MTQVKLIVTTVLLTLLIWMAADQSLIEYADVRIAIEPVVASDSNMTLSTDPLNPPLFQVRVAGTREMLARLRDGVSRITLPVSQREAGQYVLNLAEELRAESERLMNVSVEAVTPPTLKLVVDQTVTLALPLRIDRGDVEYDEDPRVEPDTVKVEIAQSELRRLEAESRELAVAVDVGKLAATWPQGELVRKEIPLTNPTVAGVPVKVQPDKIVVHARVRQKLTTATLTAVPIRFEAQIDVFNNFIIERRSPEALLTQSITVKGPADMVERLLSGELEVSGIIELKDSDAGSSAGFRYYKPRFDLPPAVELVDQPTEIELRLTKRAETPPK